jgi:hypothetical protein
MWLFPACAANAGKKWGSRFATFRRARTFFILGKKITYVRYFHTCGADIGHIGKKFQPGKRD